MHDGKASYKLGYGVLLHNTEQHIYICRLLHGKRTKKDEDCNVNETHQDMGGLP